MCDEVIFRGRYLHTIEDLQSALGGGEMVPLAEGWACEGCRHYPAEDVAAAHAARAARTAA